MTLRNQMLLHETGRVGGAKLHREPLLGNSFLDFTR